jgi:DNA-binding transcriptional ArsR family regulator
MSTTYDVVLRWINEQQDRTDGRMVVYYGTEGLAADLATRLERSERTRLPQSIANVDNAKAAANPLRHEILRRAWAEGEVSPARVAESIGAPVGNTAYHVRMLRGYKVLDQSRVSQVRGAIQHHYKLTEEGEKLCFDLFGPRPPAPGPS